MIPETCRVTVIIPIYNAERYLEKCVLSVLNQTYKDLEVILVNDGSSDRSGLMCDEYAAKDNRIKVYHNKNQGVSASRNVGIASARGTYITFVDSDDWLESNAIQSMIDCALSQKVDCVRTHYVEVRNGAKGTVSLNVETGRYDTSDRLRSLKEAVVLGKVPAYTWLLLIKKDILARYELGFDDDLSLMEDTLFYVKLLDAIDTFYIDDVVTYNYLINTNSASRSAKKILRNAKDVILVNSRLKEYFSPVLRGKINATHANRIASSLTSVYKPTFRGFREVLSSLSEIRHKTGYTKLVDVADLGFLPIEKRLMVKSVQKGWRMAALVMLTGKFGINFIGAKSIKR